MVSDHNAKKDASGIILCRRAALHTSDCSGGEGHPHRDCYCNVYWNDDEPKSPCPECDTPPGADR